MTVIAALDDPLTILSANDPADMMTPDDDGIVSANMTTMLKEGRRAEVGEIIVQIKVWEQDNRAVGPDVARFILEVDRMRCEERATHHRA